MIEQNIRNLLDRIPTGVAIVAAAKTRSLDDVRAAVAGGVCVIGENYVQEARAHIDGLHRATLMECEKLAGKPTGLAWHMIGHLQRNKVKAAIQLFDSIQTVDSLRLAQAIDRECEKMGRFMPILIEVNAAREPQKFGALPEAVVDLIREAAKLESIRIRGLMTMGPLVNDPEELRPLFRETKTLFDRIAAEEVPGVSMSVLSMGMSDSYAVAIEEGSTMVRLGTTIFGPRIES